MSLPFDDNFREIMIDVCPMGAVRMSKSDTWKTDPLHPNPLKRQRQVVARYFAYKNKVVETCNKLNYTLGNTLNITFYLPMPESWSNKKKSAFLHQPHKSKPDLDNLIKAFMDSMKKSDSDIYQITAEKRYDYQGYIIVKEFL
jgi:Holliday junction resolvase RusA-like endonuclease